MIPSDPEDRDVLAGEYVLGALDAELAAEVARSLATDDDLARRVAFWEARLMPATALVRPVAPAPSLWARIERGLGSAADRAVSTVASPGRRRPLAARVWHSAPLWRTTTVLATAAALLLAIVPMRRDSPAEPATRFFALLQSRDAVGTETGPGWLIQIAQDGTVRSLPLGSVDPGSERALQLWTLWDQARGPVSLGVLPPGGSIRLPPERLPVIGGGQLFEITLEPAAGSPTGRPTGRILFIGRAVPSTVQAL